MAVGNADGIGEDAAAPVVVELVEDLVDEKIGGGRVEVGAGQSTAR